MTVTLINLLIKYNIKISLLDLISHLNECVFSLMYIHFSFTK